MKACQGQVGDSRLRKFHWNEIDSSSRKMQTWSEQHVLISCPGAPRPPFLACDPHPEATSGSSLLGHFQWEVECDTAGWICRWKCVMVFNPCGYLDIERVKRESSWRNTLLICYLIAFCFPPLSDLFLSNIFWHWGFLYLQFFLYLRSFPVTWLSCPQPLPQKLWLEVAAGEKKTTCKMNS